MIYDWLNVEGENVDGVVIGKEYLAWGKGWESRVPSIATLDSYGEFYSVETGATFYPPVTHIMDVPMGPKVSK